MQALAIVGYKKSGKTTLAVALAEALRRRGVKAAALKSAHHGKLDKAETDTDALLKSCTAVAVRAGEESAVFWSEPKNPLDMLPLLGDAQALIVEGGKSLWWLPRVLLLRDPAEAEELGADLALATYGEVEAPGLPAVRSPGELADLMLAKGFALQGINCKSCGRATCRELAVDIVAGKAGLADCKAARPEVDVRVNGKPLAMGQFVQDIVAGSIQGMLSSLKGYAPGEITITMKGK